MRPLRSRQGAHLRSYAAQSTFKTSRCSSSGPLKADGFERTAEIPTEVRVRIIVGKEVHDDEVTILAPRDGRVRGRKTVAELGFPELDGLLPLWKEFVYLARESNRDHHRCHVSSSFRSKPILCGGSQGGLDQPDAHAPIVLSQEHTSKLGGLDRWIVERAENLLTISDRKGDERPFGLQRHDECLHRIRRRAGAYEVEHGLVMQVNACELHGGEGTP